MRKAVLEFVGDFWCVCSLPDRKTAITCSRRNEDGGLSGPFGSTRRNFVGTCGRWYGSGQRPRSTPCWRRRPMLSAGRNGTSGRPSGWDTRIGHYERRLLTSSGQGEALGATSAQAPLRDADHRAVPSSGIKHRAGVDRDVLGRGVGASGGACHRGLVGPAGEPDHGGRVPPEDLHDDRGLAAAADRGEHACAYLDGIWLKRSWSGEVPNIAVLEQWGRGATDTGNSCAWPRA